MVPYPLIKACKARVAHNLAGKKARENKRDIVPGEGYDENSFKVLTCCFRRFTFSFTCNDQNGNK